MKPEHAELYRDLLERPVDERIQLICMAASYRSGQDSCNSVYMGGMAHSGLCRILRIDYSDPDRMSYKDALEWHVKAGDEDRVNKALEHCIFYISYAMGHPVTKCPTCGSIVREY